MKDDEADEPSREDRLEAGLIHPDEHFHDVHAHLTAREAVALLERTRPADEDRVVCHGDYCLPNVLVDRVETGGTVEPADSRRGDAAPGRAEAGGDEAPRGADSGVDGDARDPPRLGAESDLEVTGYLDLGDLGVGDRWWDLAIATWSLEWNLGPGHEESFLAAYGVEPDPDRTAFYRLLYDVGP